MNGFRLDKTKLEVVELGTPDDSTAYWLTRPPEERIQALEMLRMIAYGRTYHPLTDRIPRVLEVVELQRR